MSITWTYKNFLQLPTVTSLIGWIQKLWVVLLTTISSTTDPMDSPRSRPKERRWWQGCSNLVSSDQVCLDLGNFSARISPRKMNGWNLKITQLKRKNHLNQTIMFRFHGNLPGCSSICFRSLFFYTCDNEKNPSRTLCKLTTSTTNQIYLNQVHYIYTSKSMRGAKNWYHYSLPFWGYILGFNKIHVHKISTNLNWWFV